MSAPCQKKVEFVRRVHRDDAPTDGGGSVCVRVRVHVPDFDAVLAAFMLQKHRAPNMSLLSEQEFVRG